MKTAYLIVNQKLNTLQFLEPNHEDCPIAFAASC